MQNQPMTSGKTDIPTIVTHTYEEVAAYKAAEAAKAARQAEIAEKRRKAKEAYDLIWNGPDGFAVGTKVRLAPGAFEKLSDEERAERWPDAEAIAFVTRSHGKITYYSFDKDANWSDICLVTDMLVEA